MKLTSQFLLLLTAFILSAGDRIGRPQPRLWPHTRPHTRYTTPEPQQCICPAPVQEFEYDPKYLAKSLEEAVLNFPDLTLPVEIAQNEPEVPTTPNAPQLPPGVTVPPKTPVTHRGGGRGRKTKCDNDDCRNCASQLLDKIQESGLVNSNDKKQIAQRIGVADTPTNMTSFFARQNAPKRHCNRYRFSKNIRKFTTGELPVPSALRTWVEKGPANFAQLQQRKRNSTRRNSHGHGRGRGTRQRFTTRTRTKRSVVQLGQSYNIACVKRGDPETEENDVGVVTCNMCWSWRILPSEYEPRYINELRCDTDTKCLAGYAECQQRVKSVAVKKNGQVVDVATNVCCDCKVPPGSPLHGFIAR